MEKSVLLIVLVAIHTGSSFVIDKSEEINLHRFLESTNNFPSNFTIKFKSFQQLFKFSFVKIEDELYSSLYVINKKTRKVEEFNQNYKNYASYSDKERSVEAVLVKHDDNSFKMLANFKDKQNNNYMLVPNMANQPKKRQRRSLLHSSYLIHKTGGGFDTNDKNKDTFPHKNENHQRKQSLKTGQADRHKRQTTPLLLNYETVVVIDCSGTKRIAKILQLTMTDDNMAYIIFYTYVMYGRMMNAVRNGYKTSYASVPDYNIDLYGKAILVQYNDQDCMWSDTTTFAVPGLPSKNGIDAVLINSVHNSFNKYIYNMSLPFQFDVALGLIYKYLCVDSTYCPYGVALGSAACLKASAIVFSNDYSYTVQTMGHELGHTLGAPHDNGTSNPECSGYFLDMNGYDGNNLQNMHLLSSCSISKIRNSLFDSNGKLRPYRQCLLGGQDTSQSNFFETYPFNPDEQCKFYMGSNSSFCGHRYAATNSCSIGVYCVHPQYSNRCLRTSNAVMKMAENTYCEVGKICKKQQCVSSPIGSQSQCIFEDGTIGQSEELGTLPVPVTRVSCENSLSIIKNAVRDPVAYCLDPTYLNGFSKTCCNLCRKITLQSCYDTSVNCKKTNCNNSTWVSLCPYTCGICQKQPIYCSDRITCLNGGTCVNKINYDINSYIGFECLCPPEYYGDFCDKKNPCYPNPCVNGVCNVRYLMPYCSCSQGFKGLYCDEIA